VAIIIVAVIVQSILSRPDDDGVPAGERLYIYNIMPGIFTYGDAQGNYIRMVNMDMQTSYGMFNDDHSRFYLTFHTSNGGITYTMMVSQFNIGRNQTTATMHVIIQGRIVDFDMVKSGDKIRFDARFSYPVYVDRYDEETNSPQRIMSRVTDVMVLHMPPIEGGGYA